jgi:pyruvate dehydrogenase E1 component beta subunit
MAGLRPVVEIMLVDFIAVAMDALINNAAKIRAFTGGKWQVPLVIRTTCGGGYGDGGQHEQSLWGMLAHIPGLKVVVPATPADAAGLILASLAENDPVVFLEHKLLSDSWLGFMGYGGRKTISFNVPEAGRIGQVPKKVVPIPLGKGEIKQAGDDISLISSGVSLHRCLEAARILANDDIHAEVVDLRTISPLDRELIIRSVAKTSNLVVVDEDYREFGVAGEIAAVCLEAGLKFRYARVCTAETIPYARHLEDVVLPNVGKITRAAVKLLAKDQERI